MAPPSPAGGARAAHSAPSSHHQTNAAFDRKAVNSIIRVGTRVWVAAPGEKGQYVAPGVMAYSERHLVRTEPTCRARGLVPAGAPAAQRLRATAAGVVHRDHKPSNVLIAEDGPRVIDFGISRAVESTALTQAGLVIGSPGFMCRREHAHSSQSPTGPTSSAPGSTQGERDPPSVSGSASASSASRSASTSASESTSQGLVHAREHARIHSGEHACIHAASTAASTAPGTSASASP